MSVGVVILAKSSTEELAELTNQTITTLVSTSQQTLLDIVVMEQHPSRTWPLTTTIHCPGPFNFNQFANRGIQHVTGDHLLICNNDLVFGKYAVDRLHDYTVNNNCAVVCPLCPINELQADLQHPEQGTQISRHFTGWCFLIQRAVWEQIGGFDEEFCFWYADNAVVEQLKKIDRVSEVLPSAKVTHLTSSTLKTLRRPERLAITKQQTPRFIQKYGPLDL